MPIAASPSCLRPVLARDALEPQRTQNAELLAMIQNPWLMRVGRRSLIVRPTTTHDLPAVARMNARCSARSLLDRYRSGGRPPAVAALDALLRSRFSVLAATSEGEVVAFGSLRRDLLHNHLCAEVSLLVEDRRQRLGIGSELTAHLAGAAQVAGFHEIIAYPATAVPAAQRLMIDIGRTRMVPGDDSHLHTYLPESATLGLGSVRQRLAG